MRSAWSKTSELSLADVSQSLATDAESQLFGPPATWSSAARASWLDLGDSLVDRLQALAERSEAMVQELTKEFETIDGVFPPDNNRERPGVPDCRTGSNRPGPEVTEPDWVRMRRKN